MVSPFFGPKIGEDQKKKGLRHKVSWFLVQMRLETKLNEKARSSNKSVELCFNIIIWFHYK